MQSRSAHVLEFDKVLRHLAGYAVSEAGAQACLLLAPAADCDSARMRCAFFRQGQLWAERTGFSLAPFPDLSGVFRFLESPAAVLDIDALWAVRQVLAQSRELAVAIGSGNTAENWPLLAQMLERYRMPEKALSGLMRCLGEDGLLRDESSPELLLVREEIRRIHRLCTRKVKELANTYNLSHYMQDEFLTLSSDRYVLPLKANFKGRLQGIIHEYSQTGETCYFEPMFLVEINNDLQNLKRQERAEERKVFEYLTGLLRAEMEGVNACWNLLVEADVLLARCALAGAFGGIAIDFDDTRPFSLRGVKHPLLALSSADTHPVDLELLEGQNCLIISGGNAGGKTVSLKTIGLVALMAAAGLPVPAAEGSTLPCWRAVHAFIGDEQSLEGNVSTFTAQIRNLSDIWQEVGSGSLVILDEFGAGTDPAQGAALAQAVVDELMEKNVTVCVATHFPALKAYALSREGVRAASVLFDPGTKRPLYRLAYDQVGASQALDVAREHGMPDAVLRRAHNYLLLDGEDSAALIERLNALAVSREQELDDLEREKLRLKSKRDKLEARFEKERLRLFESVQAQAQDVLRDWKQGKRSHKQALKDLAAVRQRLVSEQAAAQQEQAAPVEALCAGMTVRYIPWGKKAVIEEVDARKERLKVDLNGVSLWVSCKDVAASVPPAAPKTVRRESVVAEDNVQEPAGPPMRADLRGMRADVAVAELAAVLDNALLAGTREVEVVHGRGTGALRKEVHAFLRSFAAVDAFRLAPEGRGGDGMTIVELK
ncbi:endonuclease MutS2 [Oleidesulfovibrio alaskensis]|uniref:endonuclease MutS2 n=1 Tax=Oleidesulfovibrio alaskensis TaxID=58180 RepID=UPI00040D1009|nr:Smr/MutS family protein [Oleidesulfovibrio alaskensis]